MLTRILTLGRPVVEATTVSRAAAAAGIEFSATGLASQVVAGASQLERDGGGEASTSYSDCGQDAHLRAPQHPWTPSPSAALFQQIRAHATQSSTKAQARPKRGASPPPPPASTAAAAAKQQQPAPPAETPSPEAQPTQPEDAALQGLDLESLMRVIVHPLPLGRVRNPALFSGSGAPVVQLGNELLFFDPSHTLSSTMRALHVIRQVLRTDGHVLIVNPNPAMRPLVREAAHLSMNSNVWFWYNDWQPDLLSDPDRSLAPFFSDRCQPSKKLMLDRGLVLRNPLCPAGSTDAARRAAPAAAAPVLHSDDMRRLLFFANQKPHFGPRAAAQKERQLRARNAVGALGAAQTLEARLLPMNSASAYARGGHQSAPQLALVVSLDLSYGGDAVREAHGRNIPTVSLLNGHSDASAVTFPVYASEAHAGFQHWFLEWLLRVVNLPPPAPAPGKPTQKAA